MPVALDLGLAGYLLWGTWLVVTGLVFSFMSGIVHTYYAVALAPAVAALVGAGTVELWRLRARSWLGGLVLGLAIAATAVWSWALLGRTPDFAPGLGPVVLLVGVAAAVVVALPARYLGGRLAMAALVVGVRALLAAPAAFAYDTMQTAQSGGDPERRTGGRLGRWIRARGGRRRRTASQARRGHSAGRRAGDGFGGGPSAARAVAARSVSQAALDYLVANRGDADWIVAVSGSGSAAPIQLATGLPVMTMGGFNGGDASPTLAEFQAYVASGQVRFVIVGGNGFGGVPDPAAATAR